MDDTKLTRREALIIAAALLSHERYGLEVTSTGEAVDGQTLRELCEKVLRLEERASARPPIDG